MSHRATGFETMDASASAGAFSSTDWVQVFADHYRDAVRISSTYNVEEEHVLDAWEWLYLRDKRSRQPLSMWVLRARSERNEMLRRRQVAAKYAHEVAADDRPILLAPHSDIRTCPVCDEKFNAVPVRTDGRRHAARPRETCSQSCGNTLGHMRRRAA